MIIILQFFQNHSITIITIVLLLIALFEYYTLIRFIKFLKRPFRKVHIEVKSTLLPQTDELLQSYRSIPPESLELIKLNLESSDYNNSLANQIIDTFHKLILTVALAIFGLVFTSLVANLNFLKDNKSLQEDYLGWTDMVNRTLSSFINSLDGTMKIFSICMLIFFFIINHAFIQSIKQRHRNKHLKFIEQAEKKNLQEQKI